MIGGEAGFMLGCFTGFTVGSRVDNIRAIDDVPVARIGFGMIKCTSGLSNEGKVSPTKSNFRLWRRSSGDWIINGMA